MLATGSNTLTGYRLSIRSGADGFSFSVCSTLDGSTVQTDRFPVAKQAEAADVLRKALQKPYLMDYRFQAVELVHDTPTIVPLEHFSKGDMLAFYRLCFPGGQVSVSDMQYQILSSLEVVMIFRLDQDVLRIVQECYPDVKVCCSEAEQLEHFAAMQERRPAPDDRSNATPMSASAKSSSTWLSSPAAPCNTLLLRPQTTTTTAPSCCSASGRRSTCMPHATCSTSKPHRRSCNRHWRNTY